MSDIFSNIFGGGTFPSPQLFQSSQSSQSPQKPAPGGTPEEGLEFVQSQLKPLPTGPPGASPTMENALQRQAVLDAQVTEEIRLSDELRRQGIAVATGQQGSSKVLNQRFARRPLTVEEQAAAIAEKKRLRVERQGEARSETLGRAQADSSQTLFGGTPGTDEFARITLGKKQTLGA